MRSNGDLRRPSEVTEELWIMAQPQASGPSASEKTGKWLLFVPVKDIDEVWTRIREATESGRLGIASKVATARHNPNARSPSTKVICVYTYSYEDEEDVMRVREELRRLGFTSRIPYKTDEATRSGRYQVKGDRKISEYYC